MLIEPKDLSRLRKAVVDALGKEFVAELEKTNLDGFPQEQGRKRTNGEQLAEAARQSQIAHPLASSLRKFDRDIQKSEALGKFHLCDASVKLLHFAIQLIDGQKIRNFDLLIPRLRQRREYHAAAYELNVACSYLAYGYAVEFIPPAEGKATPDLQVIRDGQTVQIECKSTEVETVSQHNMFIQFAVRLDAAMEKVGTNLLVKIFPRIPLSGKHIDKLFDELSAELVKAERRVSFLGGAVHVEWGNMDSKAVLARTAADDPNTPSDLFLHPGRNRLDAGYASLNSFRDTDGTTAWTMERGSEIRNYFEEDIFHSLRAKIRKANRQISDAAPAIVHIEVPCLTPALFLKIVDRNFDQIQALVKTYRKIRAVVLECASIDHETEQGGNPIGNLSYVVSNPQAEHSIPSSLQIAGTLDAKLDFDLKQGALGMLMDKPPSPNKFFSKPLFVHSAPHGDEQIIIWVVDDDTFRFETISSRRGRRIAESRVDWRQLPESFEILVTWSEGEASIYVGKPVSHNLPPPDFYLNEISKGKSEC